MSAALLSLPVDQEQPGDGTCESTADLGMVLDTAVPASDIAKVFLVFFVAP